jgi:L-alanine-DL-glutamate epimerase-like enolase superfamily enzyme
VEEKMTRIESVRARTLCIPLDTATAFSTRRVTNRYYTIVRVGTDDGAEGIGFCYVGSAAGGLATMAVRELLAPLLMGQDPYAVEGLWDMMYQETLLHGRTGSVMRALSALDIALWDRNARAAGLPLYRYLGCAATEKVPAYASGGYYLEGKTPAMLAEEMRGYVAAGYRAVKMKVGRLDPRQEEQRVAAVREAIGPDTLLMLDANNAWRDLPTALEFMSRYEPYHPYWIEEPFSPDDIENHARLAKRTPVLVATGEIEAGRWRFKELLDKQAAAVLQADAAVCGGITEFRRIAQTASSYGVTLSPHWWHHLHAHLVAATPNARYVEFFPDDRVFNFRRVVDVQLRFAEGGLELPNGPGLGFNFIESEINRYAVDEWG